MVVRRVFVEKKVLDGRVGIDVHEKNAADASVSSVHAVSRLFGTAADIAAQLCQQFCNEVSWVSGVKNPDGIAVIPLLMNACVRFVTAGAYVNSVAEIEVNAVLRNSMFVQSVKFGAMKCEQTEIRPGELKNESCVRDLLRIWRISRRNGDATEANVLNEEHGPFIVTT